MKLNISNLKMLTLIAAMSVAITGCGGDDKDNEPDNTGGQQTGGIFKHSEEAFRNSACNRCGCCHARILESR